MEYPNRKNARLRHWDYSNPGCYHVTICTRDKLKLFGKVMHPENDRAYVDLTQLGQACDCAICAVPSRFPSVEDCNHIVMPNHAHMLLSLKGEDAPQLSRVVSFVKSCVTRAARQNDPDAVVWQSRFHDHIIRGEDDFLRTWEYIDENPVKWGNDEYYW